MGIRNRLQVAANVNYDILRRCLAWMRDRTLVDVGGEGGHGHERVTLSPRLGVERAFTRGAEWR